jgi:hypothetical protein
MFIVGLYRREVPQREVKMLSGSHAPMGLPWQGSLEVNQKPVARMVLASPEAPVSP